jgi:hypothetical protein
MNQPPEIPWIEAAETPWGVPVLDVRAVTQNMISTSADPQCAANAIPLAKMMAPRLRQTSRLRRVSLAR